MNRQDMVEAGAQGILARHGNTARWNTASESAREVLRLDARAVLDAVLPQITDAKQMSDIPAGSVLIIRTMGWDTAAIWDGMRLNSDLRIDGIPQIPEKVIKMYGPLTLVWRP